MRSWAAKKIFLCFLLSFLSVTISIGVKADEQTEIAEQAIQMAERLFGPEHEATLATVNQLGTILLDQGQLDRAEQFLRRARAGFEKLSGPNHLRTLVIDSNLAQLYTLRGGYSEAEPLYKRALTAFEREMGPDNAQTLRILNNLGALYLHQGRLAEAETHLRRALAARERTLGEANADTLLSANNLAMSLLQQSRYAEAEQLLNRARDGHGRIFGAEHPSTLQTISNLALLYQHQGRFREAEPLHQKVLEARTRIRGPEHAETLESINNLSGLYADQARYAEAETLYKRALDIYERVFGPDHPDTLLCLTNLATLYRIQNRVADAEPLFRRVLTTSQRVLGPDHSSTLLRANALGANLLQDRSHEKAENLLKDALTRSKRVLGADHRTTLEIMVNLAEAYAAHSRYKDAETLLQRAVDSYRRVFGAEHPATLIALSNLAAVYGLQGRAGEAETLHLQVLAARERALGTAHPDVNLSLNHLAVLSFRRRDWARAWDYWQRGTKVIIERLRRGVPAGEVGLTGTTRSEAERLSWQFFGIVKAGWRLTPEGDDPKTALAGETFRIAQWGLSSEAAKSLMQMAARGAGSDDRLAGLVRERQDLVAEWQKRDGLRDALLALPPDDRNAEAQVENRASLAAIGERIAKIDREFRTEARFSDYNALVNPEPLDVDGVQKRLHDNEALILILDTPEWVQLPEESFVWVVTKAEARWYRSPRGTKAFTEDVEALRCGLDEANWKRDERGLRDARAERCTTLLGASAFGVQLPFNTKALQIAHQLYRELLGPVEEMIAGKELLVVPSGPLTALPFQVLVTEAPDPAIAKMPDAHRAAAWLVRSHAVTVLPSVASVEALRRWPVTTQPAPEPFIGFGNPLISGPSGTDRSAWDYQRCAQVTATLPPGAFLAAKPDIAAVFSKDTPNLETLRRQQPLISTASELCAVARSLGIQDSWQAVYLGARATERVIKAMSKRRELDRYQVVHLATHGFLAGELGRKPDLQQDNPMHEAGLLFTPPLIATEEDDGLLTASEILSLKLNAEWVVLSACNTAAGDRPGTPALSGLARAFFYAGSRALLVSHWPVVSAAAVDLSTGIFSRRKGDNTLSKAEALRRAMEALLKTPRPADIALIGYDKAHPSYWAPFSLVGEPQ